MRAEGRFRAALRPMGKPTYDPRARLVSRPLERIDGRNTAANSPAGAPYRAVLVGWLHKIPGQAAARAACRLLGRRQLRGPTHATLRLSHSTCRTSSDSRARSTSPHRKTALMARSLGLLPLARPFRTPGPRFQAPCQNRRHLSPLAKVRIMLKRLVASSSSDGGSYDRTTGRSRQTFFAASV
jgi:hypothetical protein